VAKIQCARNHFVLAVEENGYDFDTYDSSYLCLGLPSCLLPWGLSTKTSCISLVSHTCHMPLPVSFSSSWSPPQHLLDLRQRTVPNGRDITAKIHTLTVLPTWQLRVLVQKRADLLLMRRTVMFWYFFIAKCSYQIPELIQTEHTIQTMEGASKLV
jgi:hypothetical protein